MAPSPHAPIRALAPCLAGGLLALAVGAGPRSAMAAPVDYSDNPLAPSQVSIDAFGKYLFDGHVAGTTPTPGAACLPTAPWSCADYITISVPQGLAISSINLDFYNSTDDRAFIALQAGNQFTATVSSGGLPGSLAYHHFGWRGLCSTTYGGLLPGTVSSSNNCINAANTTPVAGQPTDLFASVLSGSPRLTSPLPAGDYTFWIQQVSGDSEYRFTVSTINVPAPLPLMGGAAAYGWSRRLRRRLRQGGLA